MGKAKSMDVTCRELDKPLTSAASSLSDPIAVHAKNLHVIGQEHHG